MVLPRPYDRDFLEKNGARPWRANAASTSIARKSYIESAKSFTSDDTLITQAGEVRIRETL